MRDAAQGATRQDKTANGKLSKAQQTASKRFLRQWLTCEVSLQPGRAWGAHCLGQREALLGGRNIGHGRYVSLSLARFCCSSMANEQICKEPPVQCNHLGQLVTGRGSLDVYLAPFSPSQPNLPRNRVSSRHVGQCLEPQEEFNNDEITAYLDPALSAG